MIIGIQYFIFKSLRIIYKKDFSVIGYVLLFLLLSSFVFIRDFGLESHLACLLVSICLYIKSKELRYEEKYLFVKSLLLAGLFLTRTDYIYSVIPFLIFSDLFVSENKKKYFLASLSMLAGTAFLYYLSNYIFFGNLETVSGKLLNSFPVWRFKSNVETLLIDPAKLYNQFARILIMLVSLIVFGIYYIKTKSKGDIDSKYNTIILGLGIGNILFTVLHLIYNNYSIREWYMTLPVLTAIIMIVILVSKNKIALNISLILSAILLVYVFYGSRIKNYKYVSGYQYAKTLTEVVKEDESIFQVDYCGVVGFFSNKKVVDGDGLINSFEYLECLNEKRIDEYISKYKIKYYSTYSTDDLLKDSVYIDNNFSDKVNGKIFQFPKSSLVAEKPFEWNHIAFDLKGKWYLFKFK
jgi:hypothetical protein